MIVVAANSNNLYQSEVAMGKKFTKNMLLPIVAAAVVACGGGGGGAAVTTAGSCSGSGSGAVPPATPSFYAVAGTVSGLEGTLVLQNNAGDSVQVTAAGCFSFPTALAEGTAYEVSVISQPQWQSCTVARGGGKVLGNVRDVAVTCSARPAQVTTFAGSGFLASRDGKGEAASFGSPWGIAVDKDGNVLVTDWLSHRVRKISPAGDVITFAGNAQGGWRDDQGTAAWFFQPAGMALDAAGNAYVTEDGGHRIRRIAPGGAVTTFAGSGAKGHQDGQGPKAEFNAPISAAVDKDGNVYVTELGSNTVRKITSAGEVTTLAGGMHTSIRDNPFFREGNGSMAAFDGPAGIVVDPAGNVYVADANNQRIRKVSPRGDVTTLAGSGNKGWADGAGAAASFFEPKGLALDNDGNLFVADTGNHLIRKITPAGVVSTLAGKPGVTGWANGMGAAAEFNEPMAIAAAADGSLYVTEFQNNRIRKITPMQAP